MAPKKKKEKEAKVLGVKKYTKGDVDIVETTKLVDEDTDYVTTPWGTRVNAKDVTSVLTEFHSLSLEDREAEKETWVELISSMMGTREDGLKVVDVVFAPDGSQQVKFVYRKE